MTKEFEIHEEEAPDWKRSDTIEKFECQCGSERWVDKKTECKQCGAWYVHKDGVMKQVASPIGSE